MPSWLVILFERIGRQCEAGGRRLRDLGQLWPELRALIHGGVAFAPYASVFDEWLGRRLDRVEVYPASEGFVAVQIEATGRPPPVTDHRILYRVVPGGGPGGPSPRRPAGVPGAP